MAFLSLFSSCCCCCLVLGSRVGGVRSGGYFFRVELGFWVYFDSLGFFLVFVFSFLFLSGRRTRLGFVDGV